MRGERRIVNDPAARSLDQHRARFHQRQFAFADQPLRRRQQRHVQAHHIGCGEQRIQRHRLGADRLARFGIARRRIVIADAATERREGLRTALDLLSQISAERDAQLAVANARRTLITSAYQLLQTIGSQPRPSAAATAAAPPSPEKAAPPPPVAPPTP